MYDDSALSAWETGCEFAGVTRYRFRVGLRVTLWWALLTKATAARRRARRAGEKFESEIEVLLVRPVSDGEELVAIEPLDDNDVLNARETLDPYFQKRDFTIDTVVLQRRAWSDGDDEYVSATVAFS